MRFIFIWIILYIQREGIQVLSVYPYTLNNNSPRVYYVQGIVPGVLAT